jgi:1-acyl-sn-glycerol-3-phosphate acyltransferase
LRHKRNKLYILIKAITSTAARLFFRIKVIGRENYPVDEPFLLLSNHQSYFDPVLSTLSTKRELCFIARDTLFKNRHFGRLITSLNAIPLKRGESDIAAMRAILEKLKAGYGVCLYPEGTRTPDGSIAEIKPGFSLLSRRANAPVVPVVIDGMYEAWPRTRRFPKIGGKIVIKIGEPISPQRIKELGDREFSKHLTTVLRQMQSEIRSCKF